MQKVLIANRAEIAIRIARAAGDLGLSTVAVYAEDDDRCLHVRAADEAHPLVGSGPAAYLDIEQIVAAAVETGCDAVHPGYGFLSENAGLARACAAAGLTFVGPSPEVLELFGDKVAARGRWPPPPACPCSAPLDGPTDPHEAHAFFEALGRAGAVMVKAVAGGGGRGMRPVTDGADLDDALARCRVRGRGGVRERRRSTWRSCWPTPATWRSSSSATGRTSCTCGTASAASSGSARS